ncbi:MAG: hypothetical protein DVB22_000579 [Verrucomicrobia bacterium]|nr:MAG: hypothetical protein DVB22_000579 [Verrucomicrobiota bacterium]
MRELRLRFATTPVLLLASVVPVLLCASVMPPGHNYLTSLWMTGIP